MCTPWRDSVSLAITKRNDLPTTLCTILDSVNPVLYPSTDTILCVLLIMPMESATNQCQPGMPRILQQHDH
jgi:hypothetical protein